MSQDLPFPINETPYQNINPLALDSLNSEFWDGIIQIVEGRKKKIKRPGLETFRIMESSRQIDGLYWWDKKNCIIVVSDGSVYKIISPNGTTVNLTGDKLQAGVRPTFSDNGQYLVIANGGRMVSTNGTTLTAYIPSPNAPTEVTHVNFLDQWLIVNEVGTGLVHFADFVTDPFTWFAIDVFTAESDPDDVIAVYVNSRNIIVVGRKSTEFYFNDGVTPFSRNNGATYKRGGMSPYSCAFPNEVGYMFDDRRRLIKIEGTIPSILSTPFDKTIQNFDFVSDCTIDYITPNGIHLLVIQFPTQNTTLIYDIQYDYWCQWSYWNVAADQRDRFIGNCYAYAIGWNKHFFGSAKTSKLYQMNTNIYQDDGQRIVFEIRTGNRSHGNNRKSKTSYGIKFDFQSGAVEEARIVWKWRDNGESEYSNVRFIDLRSTGNTNFGYLETGLGSYYQRQDVFQFSSNAPLVVGDATEELDVNEF